MPVDVADAEATVLQILGESHDPPLSVAEVARRAGCHHTVVTRVKLKMHTAAAPKTEMVPVERLRLGDGTQLRSDLEPDHIHALIDAYLDGRDVPPIRVVSDGESYWPWDGFHRIDAQVFLERDAIECVVTEGTLADAIRLAWGANADHGLPRDDATRRRIIDAVFAEAANLALSDVAIRKLTGLSRQYIMEARTRLSCSRLQDAPEPGAKRTVHRNGTTYQQDVSRIGKNQPRREESDDEGGMCEESPPTPHTNGVHPAEPRLDPEDEFLVSLPLHRRLRGDALVIFDADALHYHRTRAARKELEAVHRREKPQHAPGIQSGLYVYYADRFLKTKHPKDWAECDKCDGSGNVRGNRCDPCHGRGYVIP